MKPSALLTLNPELQRNLWLELSFGRLAGMAIVIALITGGVHMLGGNAGAPLMTMLWIILILWGTRLAAETVSDEIIGRTWDVQRLSAQRAPDLILGKFIGGTSYVWYGAAVCVAGVFAFAHDRVKDLPDLLLQGLLAQAVTLFVALAILRFGIGGRRRISNLFAQASGIVVTAIFSFWIAGQSNEMANTPFAYMFASSTAHWYGLSVSVVKFVRVVEIAMILWAFIGMIRLMRRELGYRDGPAGWSYFVLFLMVICGGFKTLATDAAVPRFDSFEAGLIAAYIALLGLPAGISESRKFIATFKARKWRAAWLSTPPWFAAAVLTILAGIVLGVTRSSQAPLVVSALGFLLRDLIIVYGFRTRFVRRSETALVVYFALVYILAPIVTTGGVFIHAIDGPLALALPFFVPYARDGLGALALVPWVEAVLIYLLFRGDFKRMYRPVEV